MENVIWYECHVVCKLQLTKLNGRLLYLAL